MWNRQRSNSTPPPVSGDRECRSSWIAEFLLSCESLVLSLSESWPMLWLVSTLRKFLRMVGVPDHYEPSEIETCRAIVAIVLTLIFYYALFGKRHNRRRKRLAKELEIAQEQVNYLQEKLRQPRKYGSDSDSEDEDRPIRIFMDGAFDLLHFGHYNAFRLGRSLGTHLVVGVNSDESITKCKGAPLMNDEERLAMVKSCKFVDQVVPDCPYIMNKEYLDWVIKTYDIDYVVHGDDPCIVDGKDVYAAAKAAGKYRSIPRTEGVSTTDIVGRMLLLNKSHHLQNNGGVLGSQSKFLTTSRMLQLFSNVKAPTEGMKIIYIDGAWDMFHPGHVNFLKEARKYGDYLIVGIHGDAVVNERRGMNLPLMNLHERVLSVLGCRFVDDVLIDAPRVINAEMITSLNISKVICGSTSDDLESVEQRDDRYKFAKEAGIFQVIESPSDFKIGNIIERIHRNQERFQAKFERKKKAEEEFYNGKYGKAADANGN